MTARRLAAIVLLVVLVAATELARPTRSEIAAPVVTDTADASRSLFGRGLRARVEDHVLSLKLRDLQVGERIEPSTVLSRELGEQLRVLDTPGVWLVALVELDALRSPLFVRASWVDSRGRIHEPTSRDLPPQIASVPPVEPGEPLSHLLVFELPVDAIAGGALRVTHRRFVEVSPRELHRADRHHARLVVNVGISEARALELVEKAETLEVWHE